jgi:uncharacterized protein YdbL (DUF1318 family)
LVALGCVAGSSLAGCALPSIDLGTREPIKVDINVRLDVYQYDEGSKPDPLATPTPVPSADLATRREDRAADIQVFKNSRLVGEGTDGLLAILEETKGEYGDFVRDTVRAENADRMTVMKATAEKEKRSLAEVQKQQAELWRNRSFSGEYIQVKGDGGTVAWTQKAG